MTGPSAENYEIHHLTVTVGPEGPTGARILAPTHPTPDAVDCDFEAYVNRDYLYGNWRTVGEFEFVRVEDPVQGHFWNGTKLES